MIVKISPELLSLAIHNASLRLIESLRNNRNDSLFAKGWTGAFMAHYYGAIGELAAALALNVFPGFKINQFSTKESDLLGGLEVRHRKNLSHDLIIRDSDPDDKRFILTRGEPPDIEITGWIIGENGKKEEYRRNFGGYGPCWFVPAEALNPIESFYANNNRENNYGSVCSGDKRYT